LIALTLFNYVISDIAFPFFKYKGMVTAIICSSWTNKSCTKLTY